MTTPPLPDLCSTALYLDIDGTLVDHADNPADVAVRPGLPCFLHALSLRLDGALALVTGRDLDMVRQLFGPNAADLSIAANFGVDRVLGGAPMVPPPPPDGKTLAVLSALAAEFAAVPGVFVQEKGPVLALHVGHDQTLLDRAARACGRALDFLPKGYRLVRAVTSVELLPSNACKGAAVAWFQERLPFRGRRPVFLGDDIPDEAAFEWVNRRDGLSIRVGPAAPTVARHKLASVGAAHDWLVRLALQPPQAQTRPRKASTAMMTTARPIR